MGALGTMGDTIPLKDRRHCRIIVRIIVAEIEERDLEDNQRVTSKLNGLVWPHRSESGVSILSYQGSSAASKLDISMKENRVTYFATSF